MVKSFITLWENPRLSRKFLVISSLAHFLFENSFEVRNSLTNILSSKTSTPEGKFHQMKKLNFTSFFPNFWSNPSLRNLAQASATMVCQPWIRFDTNGFRFRIKFRKPSNLLVNLFKIIGIDFGKSLSEIDFCVLFSSSKTKQGFETTAVNIIIH